MKWQVVLCSVLMFSGCANAQSEKPNIIFIMTDDVGYGDIGSYGAPDIKTPVLDQLAKDGVRFTDFYANGPTCTPTRVGFVTGRYQQRYGHEFPLATGKERAAGRGLDTDGHSIAQLLKDSGYNTGLVGKWHLGYLDNQAPEAHGFDYFFGFKSGFVDYYQHTDGHGEKDLWENRKIIDEEGYLTDLITERSVQFINQNKEKPFFLSVQYNAAHWPYQRPNMPSVAERKAAHLQPHDPSTSTREDYIAIMERADQGIGEVLKALEDAGLSENTLVIFTNDNGGEWLSRNAPLFQRKWSVWEGGIRVPAIMRWPAVIPAGQVTSQVGITMDFTRTFLEIADAKLPSDYKPDGINLLPIVSKKSREVERTLFWRGNNNTRAVRSGDMKLVVSGFSSFVFNVRDDIGERNDITSVSQKDARRLRGLLDDWVGDVEAEAKARESIPDQQSILKDINDELTPTK